MKTSKNAIIFDLDGTLWDAADTISLAWNECCKALGIARSFTPDLCRSYCGKTLQQIASIVFPGNDRAWAEDVIRACCAAECAPLERCGGKLYPQELEILDELHSKYFLAVVSNCQNGYVESFFTGNNTGILFDDFENAERTGLSKGENIRLVMTRNGIERAVYIGDTEYDEEAARQACVPFIHAAYGFGNAKASDAVIEAFSEIPTKVHRFLIK